MNQSLIFDYTEAFLAAIDAATPDDVFITDGPPPAAYLQTNKAVWIGDVAAVQQTTSLGTTLGSVVNSGGKEEEFEMAVHISIYGPTTPQATNTHALQGKDAFAIFETIGATLRANQEMGLTAEANPSAYVRMAEIRSKMALKKGGNDQARETTLSFAVYVHSFLEA